MKIHHLIITIFIFGLSFLASCNKDHDNNTNPTENNFLVKTYMEEAISANYHTFDTINFVYDNEGRILSGYGSADSIVYRYNANNTFTQDIYLGNFLGTLHTVYFVGSNSFIDSSSAYYGGSLDSTTQKFIYNGNRLIRQINYIYIPASSISQVTDQIDYVYDANGNLVTETATDASGNVTDVTYTYTDKPLNFVLYPTYFAPESKNLIASKSTISYSASMNVTRTFTSTYTFDDLGRVVKQNDTYNDSFGETGTVIRSYLY